MIVAIDGPAGAGKSTIARQLSERLGFAFLDTGAMYRAVALAALRQGLGDRDADAIAQLAESLAIDFDGRRTLLDGEDISHSIRTTEVSAAVYLAADNIAVRRRLVELQRNIAAGRDLVTEGRDQGLAAFPPPKGKSSLPRAPPSGAGARMRSLLPGGSRDNSEHV